MAEASDRLPKELRDPYECALWLKLDREWHPSRYLATMSMKTPTLSQRAKDAIEALAREHNMSVRFSMTDGQQYLDARRNPK